MTFLRVWEDEPKQRAMGKQCSLKGLKAKFPGRGKNPFKILEQQWPELAGLVWDYLYWGKLL